MALSIAQAFMDGVRATLLDPNGVYWTDAELVGYYNLFVTVAIGEKPDALTESVQFDLAAGVDQVLPAEGVQFLRAPANVNGPAITQVSPEAMQEADPDWYRAVPTALVRHVIPDERDPLRFRVWPPNDGTGSIWVSLAYAPDDAAATSDPFTLTEAYREPARNCVLAMAYAKNTDRGDPQKSAFYYNLLDQRIAQKIRAQMAAQARVGTPQTSE